MRFGCFTTGPGPTIHEQVHGSLCLFYAMECCFCPCPGMPVNEVTFFFRLHRTFLCGLHVSVDSYGARLGLVLFKPILATRS